MQIHDHNSVKSATAFIEETRRRLPMAIQWIKTDHGSEFGTDFTWHLHDLRITRRPIPRGSPESNAKVERSHRTDEEKFYRRVTFRSPQELRHPLREWEEAPLSGEARGAGQRTPSPALLRKGRF